ncbi:TPA: class II lanthipeptide, LchA2/BrtA2 family [Bacillus thuringiensis]|uniref:class II lanthipeptide, LchA2/BrtA2 family n=1 Tax=Bacillus sp. CH_70 TaxID=2978215 RepID=UPI0030F65BB9|nr:class II lanthipeptide, LchA2/BrtA2 family [Bacillus thuringiensis]
MSKKEIRNFLNNAKENPVGLIQEEELKHLAGGSDENPNTHPTVTVTIPISAAVCPTTGCASWTKPCPN